MKTANFAAVVVIVNMLGFAPAPGASPKGKDYSQQRGAKAGAHTNSKGSTNTSTQWSADPERGWVRAEEQYGAKNQSAPAKGSAKNKGKPNGDKGKKL